MNRPAARNAQKTGLAATVVVRDRFRFTLTAALLMVAIVFGGGGSPAPVAELVVELCALSILAIYSVAGTRRAVKPFWKADLPFWIVVVAFVLLPLLQIVPLPPQLWHALPGRDIEYNALHLVGQENSWRPMTMDFYSTLASALALIPPVAMIFLVSRLSVEDRTPLLALVGIMGCVAALVGAIQLASGGDNWLRFYRFTNYGLPTGFEANRNHQGDILLIAMVAICAWVALHRSLFDEVLRKVTLVAVLVYLTISVVVTGSRTATALLVVVICGAIVILRPRSASFPGKRSLIPAAAIVAVLIGAFVVARDNPMLERTWNRYSFTKEGRSDLWPDAIFAAKQYWPVGSGMGTFVPVYQAAERLEVVDHSTPNRAHNDYIETAIESGLPGIVLILALAVAVLIRIVSLLRRRPAGRQGTQTLFVLFSGAVLGLHSIVDYPMRSMSLAVLAALCAGLLSRTPEIRGEIDA